MIFRRLGPALRFLREKRGKSQKDVAAAAGITPPMLSSYENGRTLPELDTLDKLLYHGLGATLAELGWALDVVNDRVPGSPRARGAAKASSPPLARSALDTQLHTLLGGGGELPPALEEGYAAILGGLVQISRFVYESVASRPGERGDD